MEYNFETNKIIDTKGKEIILQNLENKLFNLLYVKRKGQLCTYEEIANYLYGTEKSRIAINGVVYRLRHKVGKNVKIRTIYNNGFVID